MLNEKPHNPRPLNKVPEHIYRVLKGEQPALTPIKEHECFGTQVPQSLGTINRIQGSKRDAIWGTLVRTGDIIELVAPPESGKTYVVLNFLVKFALGKKFLEREFHEDGTAIFLDGELPIEDKKRRLKPIIDSLNTDDLIKLEKSLYFLDREMCGSNPINLCQEEPDGALMSHLKKHKIVVIDSLKTNSIGTNISDAKEVAKLISNLLELKNNGCTVFYVNHFNKGNSKTASGSVDFEVINDTRWYFEKVDATDDNMTIKLSFGKARGAKPSEKQSLLFQIWPDKHGMPVELLEVGGRKVSLSNEQQFA